MRLSELDRQAKIAIIEKWKQSGLSQKEFYLQEDIPAHVFYYWHKCYREQHIAKTGKPDHTFIQLKPVESVGAIEVFLSNGTRILFHQAVSSDFLKALIR